ncbi:hypothetical protein MHB42_08135 [Lysinibacillus sp. FSL K6-0232]|uniref:hypothetical protein n=1 Tax=unclassified Lysinibacillus TaxID=2636778 RepID=UPI0030FB1EEB
MKMTKELAVSMQLFMLRGAYGYKGFKVDIKDEHGQVIGYRNDTKGFMDALENATEPIDASKVSQLSFGQIRMLNGASSGSWLVPLLNRMGELGMMDLREGLGNPKYARLFKQNTFTSAINAYTRAI